MNTIISNNFYDTAKEKSFLSRLIESPKLLNQIDLEQEHFFNQQHGLIFKCISEMFDSNDKITATTICDKMNNGWVEDILIDIIRSSNHEDPVYVSNSLKNAHVRRSIKSLCESMLNDNESDLNGLDVANRYIDKFSLLSNDQKIDTVVDSNTHAELALQSIMDTSTVHMIPTGIGKLDRATGGLARGLVTVVGALGGMGKSAFLCNLYYNISNAGFKVLFISLEDDANKIHLRMISRFSRIKARRLLQHETLSMYEIDSCREARKMITFKQSYVDDSTSQTTAKIKRIVNRLQARHGLDVVIVDHIGELIRGGDVYNKTSDAIKELRDIALDSKVSMVVASQLSRKITERKPPTPMKSDLRDSGKLEEVARNIWLLNRPSYFDQDGGDDHNLQVIVDKASHGIRCTLHLDIRLDNMEITDPQEG